MLTSDFHYELPESAVAQTPAAQRDACRLAMVDRAAGAVRHGSFRDLGSCLRAGDLLVLNNSKVLPARVPCRRASGGAVEIFLLDPKAPPDSLPSFLRPAGKIKIGEALEPLRDSRPGRFVLMRRSEDGNFHFRWEGPEAWSLACLDRIGLPPLPPYIHRERLPEESLRARDSAWYQTVYAGPEGSVAAPTAGLHFTAELLRELEKQGIAHTSVTLHVGAGTFKPVKTQRLEDHSMHEELCEVPAAAAQALADCRRRGGRVVAVGTTALRTLESCHREGGVFQEGWVRTRLFILPGYRFKAVDALLTNFHQPGSTLLPLVSAFWDRESVLALYRECLDLGYRFLSYGDACFFA